MTLKLKNIFNLCAKIIKKPAVALITALVLFFNPASAKTVDYDRDMAVHQLANQTTYWKNNATDATVEIQPCAETGLCVTIVDIDPNSNGGKSLYKDVKNFINIDENASRDPDNNRTGISEICGLKSKKKFTQERNGNWSRGDFFSSFFINVDKGDQISIGGRFLVFSATRQFNATSKPAQTCMDRIRASNNQPEQNTDPKPAP